MPRTYKGGVTATKNQDASVDPLRAARLDRKEGAPERTYTPSATAAARGVIASPDVMAEVLRLLAWTDPERLQQIRQAIDDAEQGRGERLERYRTRPVSEWRQ